MVLFRNKHRPRVSFELRVGKSHLVEVLLHLRRADWDWYQTNEQDIQEEFLELMEQSVIPRMFGDLVEKYHIERNPNLVPPEKSAVGSKNKKKTSTTNPNAKQRKSRKGAKSQPIPKALVEEEEKKPDKDVYFSFLESDRPRYSR